MSTLFFPFNRFATVLKIKSPWNKSTGSHISFSSLLFQNHLIQMPNLIHILLNRSVRGELAGACHI